MQPQTTPKRPPLARAVLAVDRACTEATDPDELLETVAAEVQKAVPAEGGLWLGVDPATLLATAPGRAIGLEAGGCTAFWEREFQVQDVLLYRDLARRPVPVDTLRRATDDHPVRSTRYREFMVPNNFDDELRGVLRVGDQPWGILGLFREKGGPAFDDYDIALVSGIASSVAGALLRFAAGRSSWIGGANTPGLLMFGPDDRLVSANLEAEAWLDELSILGGLRTSPRTRDWLAALAAGALPDIDTPPALCALVSRARAVALGHERGPARLRLRGRNGRWLVLHGSCMAGPGAGDATVAVVIEPAKSAEIAPIVIEAYALSPRERDVVLGIARGLSNTELAAELYLSVHTVRDYVKSVFDKVGVSSRGELVAKLFAEHYADALHDKVAHAG